METQYGHRWSRNDEDPLLGWDFGSLGYLYQKHSKCCSTNWSRLISNYNCWILLGMVRIALFCNIWQVQNLGIYRITISPAIEITAANTLNYWLYYAIIKHITQCNNWLLYTILRNINRNLSIDCGWYCVRLCTNQSIIIIVISKEEHTNQQKQLQTWTSII